MLITDAYPGQLKSKYNTKIDKVTYIYTYN